MLIAAIKGSEGLPPVAETFTAGGTNGVPVYHVVGNKVPSSTSFLILVYFGTDYSTVIVVGKFGLGEIGSLKSLGFYLLSAAHCPALVFHCCPTVTLG